MKHYKIIKKTFVSFNEYGKINEDITYIPYIKFGFLWCRLNTTEMYPSGWVSSSEQGFRDLTKCEEFIFAYHKYHNKIGKYTIETIKKINLK